MSEIVTDELIDIVNEHDIVQQSMWRSHAEVHDIKYRRCVLIFMRNRGDGRFAILRRTAHKAYLANHWAIVGGGVQAGESYEQACVREVQEEAGIDMSAFESRNLGMITPSQLEGSFFKMLYEIVLPEQHDWSFNVQDFSQLQWVTLEQLITLKTQDLVAEDLIWLIRHFYRS